MVKDEGLMKDEGWVLKDEGWMMKVGWWRLNHEGWIMKDEQFKLFKGFCWQTDRLTNGHLWL